MTYMSGVHASGNNMDSNLHLAVDCYDLLVAKMNCFVTQTSPKLTCIESPFVRTVIAVALDIRVQGYGLIKLHVCYGSKRFSPFYNKLRSGKQRGVLGTIVSEAVRCGVLEEVLDGAVAVDMLKHILVDADKSDVLSLVVKHCSWHHPKVLLEHGKRADMLGDILREAETCGALEQLVHGAGRSREMRAILREAERCGLLEAVVEASKKQGVLRDVLVAANTAGLLSKVVQHCCLSFPESLVRNGFRIMDEILQAAESCEVNGVPACSILKNLMDEKNIWPYLVCRYCFENIGWQEMRLFFEMLIVFLIWCCTHCSSKYRRNSHSSGDHRKSVIDHVTILSGDIEKNPGPTFLFNDWLKEMFALSIRVIHGCQAKRIPWKKIHRPDPYNGKFTRSQLTALFNENLLKNADSLVPFTYTDEFQLLKTYIRTSQEPDLGQLEDLVETRKVKMTVLEGLMKLQSRSPSRQQEIIAFLDRQQLQFTVTNSKEQAVSEDGTNAAETEDEGIGVSPAEGEDGTSQHQEASDGCTEQRPGDHENGNNANVHQCEATTNEMTFKSADHQLQEVSPGQPDGRSPLSADVSSSGDEVDQQLQNQVRFEETQGLDILFGLLDKEDIFDDLQDLGQIDEVLAGAIVEAGGIPEDVLEMLLDNSEAANVSATKNSMITCIPDDSNTAVTGKSPDPCHDDTIQQDQESTVSTRLDLLQKKHEVLMSNFEKLSGLKNSDVCAYSTEDIEVLSGNNRLCRKRSGIMNQVHCDGTTSKRAKFL